MNWSQKNQSLNWANSRPFIVFGDLLRRKTPIFLRSSGGRLRPVEDYQEKLINPIYKSNPITVQKMKFISHYLTFNDDRTPQNRPPPIEVNLINLYSRHKLTILSQSISLKFELTLRLRLNFTNNYELIIQPQERLSNTRKTPKVNVA